MILLDFETRSRCDLKAHGGRLYAADPSTEPLCAVLYDTESGDVGLWLPGDPCPVAPGDVLGAHNATGFDQWIAARFWGVPATGWIDTSELARRAGLPGALDALGTRWLGLAKDKAASAFTKGLSRPSRAKARLGRLPDLTPDVMARVVAYCASDVEILAHGWPLLEPFHADGCFAGFEADVSAVDRIVNDRGICFDADLATRLIECDRANTGAALGAAARVLGWTTAEVSRVVGSPVELAGYLGTSDAQAATLEALEGHDDPRVRALVSARQGVASIAAGKLRAGLARVSPDGRLRDMHRYYGAHTGRWSGRGMQLQNIPRPSKDFESWGDAEICSAADLAGGSLQDTGPALLDVLLRATLTASPGHTLAVCDFSGVEARGLAWCAGDRAAVDTFLSGRDVYKVAAASAFGVAYDAVTKVQRNAGKMAELACGYQGGVAALLKIARSNRFDFADAGVDPADVVRAFREQHAPIVRFWRDLQGAFVDAIRGVPSRVDRFDFVPSSSGSDVAVFLPSGRPIVYNGAGLARGTWDDGRPKVSPYYAGARGREYVYGGKIAENVIQAMCRDLMADALVRAEEAGLCPVLHVHDEIVCDVPESAAADALEALRGIMLTLPEWAEGFPVGAAGHTGRRYRK